MTENFDKLIALVENKQLIEEEIIQQIELILNVEPNLVKERKRYNCNFTILHYAAFHDNPKVIQYLLDCGADPMAGDSNGNMPIHHAAGPYMTNAYEASSWEAVEIFLKHDVDVNVKGWGDLTPLHAATARGKIEIVKNLIASEANIHAESKRGLIPLHYAASSSSWETIKVFLDTEVNINATTDSGKTALHYAAETGNLEIVNKLIEHGADINIRTNDGYTLLHAAAQGQNLEIVEKFFNPIDINIEDSKGYTPILYALEKRGTRTKPYEIINFFLNKGASIVPKNCKVDVLSHLALNSDANLITYLLKHGADINKGIMSYKDIIHNIEIVSHYSHVEYIRTFKCIRMHIAKLEAAKMVISENSLKFKDVSELLSKLSEALAKRPELLEGLLSEGLLISPNGQLVYPDAGSEYNQCLQERKKEIKKLIKENKPLYDLLKEININEQINIWIKRKSEKTHKNGKGQKITLKEELEDTYQEYGGMIVYKINQIEKEIFTRNNKPLIDALSRYYGWYGLQNISYRDLVTFLTENKDDLTEGYSLILGGSQINNKTENSLQKKWNVNIVDCNDNITTPPLSLRVLTAAAYINSKLNHANVQQEACCKKR